jgi:hypothetical protein
MFRIAIAAASIAAAAITAFMVSPVKAQGTRVEIGTLTCSLSSSIGCRRFGTQCQLYLRRR